MPYKIVHAKNGFYVEDKAGKKFSNKPLTKKQAQKQRIAIAISESHKTGKSIDKFFV
jgi:hypothetical protein